MFLIIGCHRSEVEDTKLKFHGSLTSVYNYISHYTPKHLKIKKFTPFNFKITQFTPRNARVQNPQMQNSHLLKNEQLTHPFTIQLYIKRTTTTSHKGADKWNNLWIPLKCRIHTLKSKIHTWNKTYEQTYHTLKPIPTTTIKQLA